MEQTNLFKRKIYQEMLRWKEERQGETALLIEGARRIGKSTIVEEFAKKRIFFVYIGGFLEDSYRNQRPVQ